MQIGSGTIQHNILEIRLTWHLLNVSDPSGRNVLDDVEGTPEIEYSQTEGFNISLFVTDKEDNVNQELSVIEPYFYSWETWEKPEFQTRLKEVYFSLKDYFQNLKPYEDHENSQFLNKETFTICDFHENKKGAVSISFDDAGYTQYQFALPELDKYYLKASFGITDEWLQDNPGLFADEGSFKIKRLGINEVNKILDRGNEISLHGLFHKHTDNNPDLLYSTDYIKEAKIILEQRLGKKISTIHFPPYDFENSLSTTIETTGLLFGRGGSENMGNNQPGNINYKYLNSILMIENFPDQYQLDSILKQGRGKWTIFSYHHFFEPNSNEFKLAETGKYNNTWSINPETFKKQIRLIRNSGYWIAPISTIGKYLKEKEEAEIEISRYSNLIFLTITNNLDGNIYNQPLTIEFSTPAKKVKISGSASDGDYENRIGKIYFSVLPNKEVTIEIIE